MELITDCSSNSLVDKPDVFMGWDDMCYGWDQADIASSQPDQLVQSSPPSPLTLEPSNLRLSSTFLPGGALDPGAIDIILLSSDSVLFYTNSTRLLSASRNGFGNQLPILSNGTILRHDSHPVLKLPESSSVLNVILHIVFDVFCAQYSLCFDDFELSVAVLQEYGLSTRKALAVSSPLYMTALTFAPIRPLDVFTLAAQYDLDDLAKAASSHLMSYQLSELSDEMAENIGAKYLKKLFRFHLERIDSVRTLVSP